MKQNTKPDSRRGRCRALLAALPAPSLATLLALLTFAAVSGWHPTAGAYPMDGFDYSGIRRLLYTDLVQRGEIQRPPQPRGATLPLALVQPGLVGQERASLPFKPDPELGRQIRDVLGQQDYAVALLDLSDPKAPVYAEMNGAITRNIGSVGKLVVALAWFQTLADVYPDDIAARQSLQRETVITADEFVISDHHEVILFDPETGKRSFRILQIGDQGTLWDWLDWMLSASNNAAAATIQKQTMLLEHFGRDYPPTAEQEKAYFDNTTYAARGEQFLRLMNTAVTRNGMDTELLRQGSFFTYTGKRRVGGTSSYGNMRELVHMLYLLERGELVDFWSSREFKRLLYMTQKRIRYASHPALQEHAVYFKSGSLYSCMPEEGFTCGKYMGNKVNLLASLAIVEGPVGKPAENTAIPMDHHYLIAVSSNVLRVNSSVAHQTLALRIHRLIEARNAARLAANRKAAAMLQPSPEPEAIKPGVEVVHEAQDQALEADATDEPD